jgi:sugar lactone lactonase YvrE
MRFISLLRCLAIAAPVLGASPLRAQYVPKLYWSEPGSNTIKSSNLDGSNPQVLLTAAQGVSDPRGIAIDTMGGRIYWVEEQRIKCASLDGNNVQTIIPSLASGWGIDIDIAGRKIYYVDSGIGMISRANLDGSAPERLLPFASQQNPIGIDLDVAAGKMYWVHGVIGLGTGGVRRANLDGSQIENVVTAQQRPLDIAVEPGSGKLYFTDQDLDAVRSANLNGSSLVTLASNLVQPNGIDVFDGWIYWADVSGRSISRMRTDGSERQELFSDIAFPRGIAVLVPELQGFSAFSLAAISACWKRRSRRRESA